MIEVRLTLLDAHERALFGQLMDILEAKREGRLHEMQPQEEPAPRAAGPVVAHIEPDPDGGEPTVSVPEPVAERTEGMYPAHGAPYATGEKVEYADLEKVVLAYLNKHGVPATREKIAAFGYAKLDQVPAEKWAELKSLFEGWLS